MSHDILKILENIKNQNVKFKQWKNKKLYRLLWNKDLLKLAYNNIKSKPGSMTPDLDLETLDGINENYLDKLILSLKLNKFQFKPSKIKKISKPNGTFRKISIPSSRDKIVQESIRLILESIFEVNMSPFSHGFRPGRSCHTALNDVRYKWPGTEWFLEFDIEDFFDSIDHQILVQQLKLKTDDDRFIQLIYKYLKAGYLENFRYKNSVAGTPQGSTIGPILSNIFLTQLDKYVEQLSIEYECGKRKPVNKEYIIIRDIKDKDRKRKEMTQFKKDGKIYTERCTDKYIRLRYVRYADDFIIGICGSKKTAAEIQEKIIKKLHEIKLKHNIEKTNIVDAYHPIKFLGVYIQARKPSTSFIIKNGVRRSLPTGSINIKCNIDELVQKLHKDGFCDKSGFPIACNKLINFTLEEIVIKYNQLLIGLINYFKPVDNFYNFRRIQYILHYSLAKTIAGKLKISMPQVFKKYGKNIKISEKIYFKLLKAFTVSCKWKNCDDFSLENYRTSQRQIFIVPLREG